MKPKAVALPDGRVWLRVAKAGWSDPLDPSHAAMRGGRWDPPNSFPTLYLNGDARTARLQLQGMLDGYPVDLDDLEDDAFVLVAATLPRAQSVADAVSAEGLGALGLPMSYPLDPEGTPVPHTTCQPLGVRVRAAGLRGVLCRTALAFGEPGGSGQELAWYPASSRARQQPLWAEPLPLSAWLHARTMADLGLPAPPG